MKKLVLVLLLLNAGIAILSLTASYVTYRALNEQITGHVTNQGQISLTVEGEDSIPPQISINYPTNITYSSQVNNLNYTVSDNFQIDSCWYSVNDGTNNYSIACGENLTGLSATSGSYVWKVYANDSSGNENFSSVNFAVTISSGGSGGTGGSGGGGGSSAGSSTGSSSNPILVTSGNEINLITVSGEQKVQQIFLMNKGITPITVILSLTGIEGMASLESTSLVLQPGEQKFVNLIINSGDPGVFAGKVVITYGSLIEEVFVVLNVRSSNALFDVSLSLPQFSKVISTGQILKTFISLLQVGPAEEVDVTVNYLIKDFDGNTLASESETFRVFKNKNYVKDFDTSTLENGDYIAGIEVIYPEGIATSSAHFTIDDFEVDIWVIATMILSVVVVLVVSYSFFRAKNGGKRK